MISSLHTTGGICGASTESFHVLFILCSPPYEAALSVSRCPLSVRPSCAPNFLETEKPWKLLIKWTRAGEE